MKKGKPPRKMSIDEFHAQSALNSAVIRQFPQAEIESLRKQRDDIRIAEGLPIDGEG